jgi:hypothetical protein
VRHPENIFLDPENVLSHCGTGPQSDERSAPEPIAFVPGARMGRISLLLLILALGCHDLPLENGFATGPEPARVSTPLASSLGTSGAFWARLSPEEKRAALQIAQEVYAEQHIARVHGRIAIVRGDLPAGRRVVLIQDPRLPDAPILVLGEGTADESSLFLGISAFADGIDHVQNRPDSRVRWLVMPEHRITVRGVDALASSTDEPLLTSNSPLVERLRRASSSVQAIQIPGVGSGILFQFQ